MSEEKLNSIQELIERKILLAEVNGGLTSSDKKFIDLWNYTIDLQQELTKCKEVIDKLKRYIDGCLELSPNEDRSVIDDVLDKELKYFLKILKEVSE